MDTETDLANDERSLPVPEDLRTGAKLIGGTPSDLILPRAHVFQDSAFERDGMGRSFELGDLVDPIECRKLATNKFVPVGGRKQYVKWQDGEKAPVYVLDEKSKVPPEDLAWGPNRKPPAAQETLLYLVLVDGESFPYLLPFKRTGLHAGRTLHTLERRRGLARRGPGLYELTWTKESGPNGIYARIGIRGLGDPTDELQHQLREVCQSFLGNSRKARW